MSQESAVRIARAQQLMELNDLDALLLSNGPNLFYFTGYPRGPAGSRPYLLLIPQTGAPVLSAHCGREDEVRALTPIEDIQIYDQLSHAPVESIAERLVRDGHQRVGMELGHEHYLDMQTADFQRLRKLSRGVEFLDAGDLLWQLRMVKSQAEVEAIRRACSITGRAYDRVFSEVKSGMVEAEIETQMLAELVTLGGRDPWVLITSGSDWYTMVSKGGTDRHIERGNMVWMDAGCTVDGYYADFSRAGVMSGPTEVQRSAQRHIHDITLAGIEAIRPGASASEVSGRCQPFVDALPLDVTARISDLAGRVGHGLGLTVTEWPSLDRANQLELQPGMVLTVEPGFATSYGVFHVEENVVVTETGCEVLSTCSWELRALG